MAKLLSIEALFIICLCVYIRGRWGDAPNIIRRHNGELLNKLHKWRPHAIIHDNITKHFTMKKQ